MGIASSLLRVKLLYFIGGAVLLFGYGFALNSAPIAFEKVVGIYIATLFVMWQLIAFVMFRAVPSLPNLVEGTLIVAGGLIVAFWRAGEAG